MKKIMFTFSTIISIATTLALPNITYASVGIEGGPFTYNFVNYVDSQDYYDLDGNITISWHSTTCQADDKMTITLYDQYGFGVGRRVVDECGGQTSWTSLNVKNYWSSLLTSDGDGNRVIVSGSFQ